MKNIGYKKIKDDCKVMRKEITEIINKDFMRFFLILGFFAG